jgi:hypothetical protein
VLTNIFAVLGLCIVSFLFVAFLWQHLRRGPLTVVDGLQNSWFRMPGACQYEIRNLTPNPLNGVTLFFKAEPENMTWSPKAPDFAIVAHEKAYAISLPALPVRSSLKVFSYGAGTELQWIMRDDAVLLVGATAQTSPLASRTEHMRFGRGHL